VSERRTQAVAQTLKTADWMTKNSAIGLAKRSEVTKESRAQDVEAAKRNS
jgi:hypothetical protein